MCMCLLYQVIKFLVWWFKGHGVNCFHLRELRLWRPRHSTFHVLVKKPWQRWLYTGAPCVRVLYGLIYFLKKKHVFSVLFTKDPHVIQHTETCGIRRGAIHENGIHLCDRLTPRKLWCISYTRGVTGRSRVTRGYHLHYSFRGIIM